MASDNMAELPDTAAARNFVAAIPRFTAIAAYTTLADLEDRLPESLVVASRLMSASSLMSCTPALLYRCLNFRKLGSDYRPSATLDRDVSPADEV
jgi:hypothetical protein